MNLKQRSGGCEEAWTAQLDSNAREAKERLDQKLRNQRQSVAKRYLRFFFVRATTLLEFHVLSAWFTLNSDLERMLSEIMC